MLIQSLRTSTIRISINHHAYTCNESKDSGGNVTQSTRFVAFLIFREGILLWITGHDERHGVGGVRGVRVPGLFVDRLLGISMISGDKQNVSGLLASLVYRADGVVGGRDGLNRRIKDPSVANLTQIYVSAGS